jgi:predicted CopG family antitoxin
MKTINISFEDKEFNELIKRKGKQSWKEFILKKEAR